ncbi:hypothetical protein QYF36_023149 [Acer negundo]|nr:hypothetical protein QYF36_023149 [Acer negundo]
MDNSFLRDLLLVLELSEKRKASMAQNKEKKRKLVVSARGRMGERVREFGERDARSLSCHIYQAKKDPLGRIKHQRGLERKEPKWLVHLQP